MTKRENDQPEAQPQRPKHWIPPLAAFTLDEVREELREAAPELLEYLAEH